MTSKPHPRRATGRHSQQETGTALVHRPAFMLSFELDLEYHLNNLRHTIADRHLYSDDFRDRWIEMMTRRCATFDQEMAEHIAARHKPLVATVPEADQDTRQIDLGGGLR